MAMQTSQPGDAPTVRERWLDGRLGSDERIVEKLLAHARRAGFEAVCVVVDKGQVPAPVGSGRPRRLRVNVATREALARFGGLTPTLEKR